MAEAYIDLNSFGSENAGTAALSRLITHEKYRCRPEPYLMLSWYMGSKKRLNEQKKVLK